MFAVASNLGWGAVYGQDKIQGQWKQQEDSLHINVKELLASYYGLKYLCANRFDSSIHIKSDNPTAISYVNKMGGVRSADCRIVAFNIWNWCELYNIWLTASHIPGQDNGIADSLSRNFSPSVEWELSQTIFEQICYQLGTPSMELFASRHHNTKLEKYCSLFPDSCCFKTDAFPFLGLMSFTIFFLRLGWWESASKRCKSTRQREF